VGLSAGEFEDFVSSSTVWLTRLAVTLTGDRGAAEDLVQEVLCRTYLRRSHVDDPRAYVTRGLVNLSNNRWRTISRRREVPLLGDVGALGSDSVAASVERDRVVRALGQLSARQRTVVALRYLEDFSEAETARLMGVSVGSVKTHTARALARLNTLLGEEHDAPFERRTT
jgi:RNA polymerase sigma-70 factor (sigma-E family)